MYDDTAKKLNEIAERILMLGGTPANKFSDYLKVANINEVDKISKQALNNILQSISYLIGEERKILFIASQSGRRSYRFDDERLSERTGKISLDVDGL